MVFDPVAKDIFMLGRKGSRNMESFKVMFYERENFVCRKQKFTPFSFRRMIFISTTRKPRAGC